MAVSIAGCAGDDDDEGNGDTPTVTATETAAATRTRTTTRTETETETVTETDTETPTETETETPTETETDTPEPTPTLTTLESIRTIDAGAWGPVVTQSGSGQTVTNPFELGTTVTTVTFEHSGSGNFIVWLQDPDTGEDVELLANEIGAIEGATAVPVDGGTYRMDIDADGDWTVELANPVVGDQHLHELPVEASGTGQDLVGVVYLDGNTIISGSHLGESNFIVNLYAEADTGLFAGDLVFNEIGTFEGETTSSYSGYCWIDVQADGDWSLTLE